MNPETLFTLANSVAVIGWLVLIFAGRKQWAHRIVSGTLIPVLLGVVYTGLVLAFWGSSPGGFGALGEVQLLFSNPWMLLAGWIHYLSFDLFVGSWEVRDAQANGIAHPATIPSLLLTFLFGPIGLLSYLGVRMAIRRVKA